MHAQKLCAQNAISSYVEIFALASRLLLKVGSYLRIEINDDWHSILS
jgi:hypothetical protein